MIMMSVCVLLFWISLYIHTCSSTGFDPENPDVWLNGFEPNGIDGMPVTPPCKVFPVMDGPKMQDRLQDVKPAIPETGPLLTDGTSRQTNAGQNYQLIPRNVYDWIMGRFVWGGVSPHLAGARWTNGQRQRWNIPLYQRRLGSGSSEED